MYAHADDFSGRSESRDAQGVAFCRAVFRVATRAVPLLRTIDRIKYGAWL